jgi:hypothetical protein
MAEKKKRDAYQIVVGKPEGKRPPGGSKYVGVRVILKGS